MDAYELKRVTRKKILVELFGDNFRLEDPLETMGGVFGRIATGSGVPNERAYMISLGIISGLRTALNLLDESTKEVYDPPQQET